MPALRPLRRLAAIAALVIAGAPGPARADDPDAARAAYDRGAAAFEARRYAEAALELARADALAPNPVALGNALKAAELADDPVLAMTLADRVELRPGASEATISVARRVREKMGPRVGKLSIRCAAASTGPQAAPSPGAPRACAATVDAEPFPVDQQRWIKAGAHAVEIAATGAAAARFTVTVEAGKTLEWAPPSLAAGPPKVEPPSPPPPPPRGISPAWFAVGAGLTAVAGGFLIASGVDAMGKHSDYVAFIANDPAPGQRAQTRTNVLVGVTAALGVATAAVGVFAVRWSPSPASSARALVLTAGPAGAACTASF